MDSQTMVCGINCCNLDYIYIYILSPEGTRSLAVNRHVNRRPVQ